MRGMKSPNFWVGIASVLALSGLGVVAAGWLRDDRIIMNIGMWMLSPLLICGVVAFIVVIPILIVANRRRPPE